jgi:hypothetical protein
MTAVKRPKTVPHIYCDGARYHVLSYHLVNDQAEIHCSEPRCEINEQWKQDRRRKP